MEAGQVQFTDEEWKEICCARTIRRVWEYNENWEYGGDGEAWEYNEVAVEYFDICQSLCENIISEIAERYLVSVECVKDEIKNGGVTLLHCAAELGKIDFVSSIVYAGENVNVKDCHGYTPLHSAAQNPYDDIEIVKFLVSLGADVRAKSDIGMTPLHLSVRRGNIKIAELLVSKGANIRMKNERGETPLHVSALGDSIDVIKYLVSEGANVNAVENEGATPLHLAAENENAKITKCLVFVGASLDAKDIYGRTPLKIAKKVGNTAVVECLECLEWGWGFGGYSIDDEDDF